jgi:release factor glutamine methyltransferase
VRIGGVSLHPADAPSDALIARLRAAGCVFAEDEAALLMAAAGSAADLEAMAARRVAGLPLEHVVGWAEFAGLRLAVEPGVFVPRHRTEALVEEAARLALRRPAGGPGAVVVDLCCGCGALGVALVTALRAAGRPEGALHAADVEPAAVRSARRNVEPLGGHVHQGDLYAALPRALAGRVDVLLANVPYVPTAAIAMMPPEARLHEPRVALDGGDDGLDVLRRVAREAPDWLAPGGHLLLEISERQAAAATAALAAHGLTPRLVSTPEADVLAATR